MLQHSIVNKLVQFRFSLLVILFLMALVSLYMGSMVHATGSNTQLVSRSSSGTQGNATTSNTNGGSVSRDGNLIVFDSTATNLVAGDTNNYRDIFLHDISAGTTIRINVANGTGNQANNNAFSPRISDSGRYVVYRSNATNLTADTVSGIQIFRYDVNNQTTQLASITSAGTIPSGNNTSDPDVSSDGRFVSFETPATNLVSGTTSYNNIYVKDMVTGTLTRVTNGNGHSQTPVIDCSGRFVAFASTASDLVASDTNGHRDIFYADLSGSTPIIAAVTAGNNDSTRPSISCGGDYVAFESVASDIVAGDTNNFEDVFLYDRINGPTKRISVDSYGTEANNDSAYVDISANGRYVAYYSYASNLVASDTNSSADVFFYDAKSASTSLISIASGGGVGNGTSFIPSISADGAYIAYFSDATNLIGSDTNGHGDLFVTQSY